MVIEGRPQVKYSALNIQNELPNSVKLEALVGSVLCGIFQSHTINYTQIFLSFSLQEESDC